MLPAAPLALVAGGTHLGSGRADRPYGDLMSILPLREVAAWLATPARLVLDAVWVAGGALKLPDPAETVGAVRGPACHADPNGADGSAMDSAAS
jgi:hypothetical protein